MSERNLSIDQMRERKCPFCEIIASEKPVGKISETDRFTVFTARDSGYPLIVPKIHIVNILDPNLDVETARELGQLTRDMARAVQQADEVDSITIAINNGPDAGQEIPHLHVHVIPRMPRDSLVRFHRGVALSPQERDQKAAKYRAVIEQQE